jgi:hypothetical protein
MLRVVKTTFALSLVVAGALLGAGCGGSPATTYPPPGVYYNLIPGVCAEYSDQDGGLNPSVGVHIQTSTNPPGIELRRVKHGVMDENDFLSFAPDGGGVFLAEREYATPDAGPVQEVYTTPLKYLAAPPLGTQTLDSSSVCASGSVCTSMSLDVSVQSSKSYTGALSVPDGGMIETELYFTYTYDDGGMLTADQREIVPGIGFTDLYLVDTETNNLAHYLLVDIIPDDGGCAEH